MRVIWPPMLRLNESLRLWAGSVEINSTRRPVLAAATARAEDTVVLPTPPLPPTIISLRSVMSLEISRTGCSAMRTSAAAEIVQRRALHAHAGVPVVETFHQKRL